VSEDTALPAPDDWPAVREWRKATRARLIDERRALPRGVRTRTAFTVTSALRASPEWFAGKRLGFYWPMKSELDLVSFVRSVLPELAAAALPVIVEKQKPLEFWRWTARTELCNRGVWNIPYPAERVLVEPEVLLVPLVGFDAAGYRLGYGGGYYDRTLAAFARRPFLIGVGYELGRLPTILPQPHDIPLDVILTEQGRIELTAR
jgi:5-formyltetrahydrofolate cyclo-ligase